ncbi:ABC transporter ATP-binding protein [Acidomonas methanolica]|uniref:ABC transporter ATP-binding protein n=1 Tax=Acidomonas methanolica TaxID=437 RepID=UPI0009DF45B9|nr:ATP-binding cassette domain-containing protein [Acidomonas methanolica]TCS25110.1 phospholipid/cholesterol/gamma-HCH transport system ATP-binding protein [Acidomonas methanolica]
MTRTTELAAIDKTESSSVISVRNLTISYGSRIIQKNVSFEVKSGSVFAIMGPSGCGKSTLIRSMVGLLQPTSGTILVNGTNYWSQSDRKRVEINRSFGVVFQSGAIWSSMTVGENVALPLQMFTSLNARSIRQLVQLKLGLVGLSDAIDLYPSEISGGMLKRAGLARALALDPKILLFDEVSAGLDPIASARLDDLILALRDGLGATILMVSHELPSLLALADDGIFLSTIERTAIAHGSPQYLKQDCNISEVFNFMHRLAGTTET